MEEIKINDKVYILKEEYEKLDAEYKILKDKSEQKKTTAKRFEADKERKILQELNHIFNSEENSITEEEAIKNGANVCDAANVCMICGKSEEAKRLLARFISPETEQKTIPKWDFKGKDVEQKGRYSFEYISKLLDVFKAFNDDFIDIKMIRTFPIWIENEHIIGILAPRLTEEELEAEKPKWSENG
jgi:hypothetical protein